MPRLTELVAAGPSAARRRRLGALLPALVGAPASERPVQQSATSAEKAPPLARLVSKLNACVAQ